VAERVVSFFFLWSIMVVAMMAIIAVAAVALAVSGVKTPPVH